MTSLPAELVRSAIRAFLIEGELLECRPHKRGHIHDTFISTWRQADKTPRYLHQRMNDRVFTDIPTLMHNIERIGKHMAEKQGGAEDLDGFHILDLVPTTDGRSYLTSQSGPWRTYRYIENSSSYDRCDSPAMAFEAARAFGWFQAQLVDLPSSELRETLPRFFSSPFRLEQFDEVLARDPVQATKDCATEIRFVQDRRDMTAVMDNEVQAGHMPLRIVHGDTKLNNILFDDETGAAKSIVDLDTCMPAYSLYDFGDLVRFTAATSSEDEQDLDQVGTDLELYSALVTGYLDHARAFLTTREIELMPFSARLVTLTIGMRFLTDHLAGNVYFKVDRPGQNLDRARVQFKMVEGMEHREKDMAVR